jgi:hypothetical protein
MKRPPRLHDSDFRFKAPSELIALVEKHARSRKPPISASSFTRAALIAALKADGARLPAIVLLDGTADGIRASTMRPRVRETAS